MRLRLVIPAAIAAAATYAALVRDDAAGTPRGALTPMPASDPSLAPPVPVHASGPIAPPPAESPRPPAPALQSTYVDLAPPPSRDVTTPSVYDLLAGAPRAETPAPDGQTTADHSAVSEAPTKRTAPPADEAAGMTERESIEPANEITLDPWHVAAPHALAPVNDDGSAVADVSAVEPTDEYATDVWHVPLDEGRFALGGWAAAAGHSMVSAVTFRRRLPEDIAADRIVLVIDASDNVPDDGLVVLADPGFAPDRDGFTLRLAAADPGPFSAAGSYRVLPAD